MSAELTKTGDGYAARYVRVYDHPVRDVWAMLTDNAQLGKWFAELRVDELRTGGAYKFDMGDGTFETMAIRELEPEAVLAFEWGEDRVRFELVPVEAGTKLTMTESIGRLTDHTPRDLAGWHVCLDVIGALLDGRTFGSREAAWQPWYERYKAAVERLRGS